MEYAEDVSEAMCNVALDLRRILKKSLQKFNQYASAMPGSCCSSFNSRQENLVLVLVFKFFFFEFLDGETREDLLKMVRKGIKAINKNHRKLRDAKRMRREAIAAAYIRKTAERASTFGDLRKCCELLKQAVDLRTSAETLVG